MSPPFLKFQPEGLKIRIIQSNAKSDEKSDSILEMENRFGLVGIGSSKTIYIETIHNMRKPVISSEIGPKFDGVSTTYILPLNQLFEITK